MVVWLFLAEVTNRIPSEYLQKHFEFMPFRPLENALLASWANIDFISDL